VLTAACGSRCKLIRIRIWDQLLARWRDLTLDAHLAEGQQAEDDRAVRAGTLTTPAARHRLADGWENVFGSTAQPRQQLDPHVPVRSSRILAAEDDIRQIISLLRASTPVSARGVAIANLLLTDGTGPP
jgi:type II secretory pathway component PulK